MIRRYSNAHSSHVISFLHCSRQHVTFASNISANRARCYALFVPLSSTASPGTRISERYSPVDFSSTKPRTVPAGTCLAILSAFPACGPLDRHSGRA